MQYGVYKHEAETFLERIVEAMSWGVAADGFIIISVGPGFVVEGLNLAEQPITIASNHDFFEVRPGSTDTDIEQVTMKPPHVERPVSSIHTGNWDEFFYLYATDNFKLVGLSDYTLLVNGYKWDDDLEDYVFVSELFYEVGE